MNTHADKAQENKSQAVSAVDSQMKSDGESTFQFIDNRPEAIAQRNLQEMANNSPQAKQAAQLQAMANNHSAQQQLPIQKKENNTGLPDSLKTGMENLSGMSLDDVKVHRNSDKPAQLQAHAYAQGTDIHLGPGQEKHLPHEAWHVVQQKQRRVKPTMQMKGKVNVNDDAGLEKEADVMGEKSLNQTITETDETFSLKSNSVLKPVLQGAFLVGKGWEKKAEELDVQTEKWKKIINKEDSDDESDDSSSESKEDQPTYPAEGKGLLALGFTTLKDAKDVEDKKQYSDLITPLSQMDGTIDGYSRDHTWRSKNNWEDEKDNPIAQLIYDSIKRTEEVLESNEFKTNLRLFAEQFENPNETWGGEAETWQDYQEEFTEGDDANYRKWFEEVLLAKTVKDESSEEISGRIYFNLTNFSNSDIEWSRAAAELPDDILDHQVNSRTMPKTIWELAFVLRDAALFGKTEFYRFDKTKDKKPSKAKDDNLTLIKKRIGPPPRDHKGDVE